VVQPQDTGAVFCWLGAICSVCSMQGCIACSIQSVWITRINMCMHGCKLTDGGLCLEFSVFLVL